MTRAGNGLHRPATQHKEVIDAPRIENVESVIQQILKLII
ncbi:hypothetical protein FHR96_001035 [Halomonas organivorans]|uniref:Uncharacterized protein n=1 Tax=Halomonas organivorans TaxID=257772 RepID=A0A7W5BWX6_9GAMM|nr:hypothetical protein [Halomonas organivorans]